MDLKLQQALVAARAGEPETAQLLLAERIQEQPEDANAWFMLSYLVDTSERQARYLQQTLVLDPNHPLAREHLQRLRQGVPPPVIRSKQRPPAAKSTNLVTTVPAAATPPAPTKPPQPAASELPEWLQDLDNKHLGTTRAPTDAQAEWARSAGTPKRQSVPAAGTAVAQAAVPEKTIPAPLDTTETGTVSANQKLLLGVLFALVLMSMLVLGVLLWQIFV